MKAGDKYTLTHIVSDNETAEVLGSGLKHFPVGNAIFVALRIMKNYRRIVESILSLLNNRLDIQSPWFLTDPEEMILFIERVL